MIEKFLALTLVLVLVSGVAAFASVNGGFHQKAFFKGGNLKTATELQLDDLKFIGASMVNYFVLRKKGA